MMNKRWKIHLAAVALAVMPAMLTGCGGADRFGKLPETPMIFLPSTYTTNLSPSDGYACLVYRGRIYIPYGTQGKTLRQSDVKECLGYVRNRGDLDDKSNRVYTLAGDEDENYLMTYLTEGFMEQPFFYRAIDTQGQEIFTPDCIDSLDYDFWR